MKEIEVTTCQGIGDTFWVHQLIMPNVDSVKYEILHVGTEGLERQTRAAGFLKLLPKVASVTHRVVGTPEYEKLVTKKHSLPELLWHGRGHFAANARLESGERIEDIAEGLPFAEKIPVTKEPVATPPGSYVCLYVSEGTLIPEVVKAAGLWELRQWVEFVRGVYEKYTLNLPLVITGTSYDQKVTEALRRELDGLTEITVRTTLTPGQCVGLIQGCELFLGYQSGLNVLVDQADHRQCMLYFPHLNDLRYSWPSQTNIARKAYHSDLFSNTPDAVLRRLPWATI